jgi:hypothetical protein
MRKTLFLVLALSFVFLNAECCSAALAKNPVVKKPVAKKAVGKNIDQAADKQAAEAKTEKRKSRSEIKYTGFDSKRDPFTPPAVIAKILEKPDKMLGAELAPKDIKLPKVDLQGIIWSKKFPQVIINGAVMKVGDFIQEFEIKEIRQTSIVIFLKGNDYIIKMTGYAPAKSKNKKR